MSDNGTTPAEVIESLSDDEDFSIVHVLDKGYVKLVDVMGGDLSVVNAAKASFARSSDKVGADEVRLINFLARNDHTSPFRHAMISFEVKAPLMVARQWWKYVVGSDHTMDGWNEASRRYVTSDTEFYIVDMEGWRGAPADKKQGSVGFIGPWDGEWFTTALEDHVERGERLYSTAIEFGIAPEQARLFLSAYALYINFRWSASLQSVAHFINQRVADDAQHEISEYAKAILRLSYPHFTHSIKALCDGT